MQAFQRFLLMVGFVVFLGLTGCQTCPTATPITKYVVVQPTDQLIRNCDIKAVPPDPQSFAAAISKDREQMLTDYAAAQQADIAACNVRWVGLRSWLQQQAANYSAPPASSAQ